MCLDGEKQLHLDGEQQLHLAVSPPHHYLGSGRELLFPIKLLLRMFAFLAPHCGTQDDDAADEEKRASSSGDSASSTSSMEEASRTQNASVSERVAKLRTDLEQIDTRVAMYEKVGAVLGFASC